MPGPTATSGKKDRFGQPRRFKSRNGSVLSPDSVMSPALVDRMIKTHHTEIGRNRRAGKQAPDYLQADLDSLYKARAETRRHKDAHQSAPRKVSKSHGGMVRKKLPNW